MEKLSNVRIFQLADDISLCTSSKQMHTSIAELKITVNHVADWLDNIGLILAPDKTQLCAFNRIALR